MKEILLYLENLVKNDDTIVVATSGGPDSMFLLHLLCELKSKINFNIVVAHVNHKLRSESEEEAEFVESYACRKGFIYEYREIKEYNHDNLENAAREKRYEFFKELVGKYQAKYLMTAHHGDDLMETILMRIVRGSSLKGYAGFRREVDSDTYSIIRPLITITKQEILDFMDSHKLKYYIDKSNFSDCYTRNRYRAKALPFFKEEDANVHLKFLKFSQELIEVNNFLDDYIKDLIDGIKDSRGISITKLKKLNNFLLRKVIQYELSLIYVNDLFLVSDKNTEEIIKLINSSKSNLEVGLPNNYRALKEYDYFRVEKLREKKTFSYVFDEYVQLDSGIIKRVDKLDSKSNYVIRLNSKEIELPLIVRNRREGDKIEIKNLNGTKKVKDIYIDEKIPKQKRDTIPIVSDSKNRIIWIPGVKKSKFDVECDGIYDIILSYEEE